MAHNYNAPRRSNNNPISKARLERGITQEQLGQMIGVDKRQISAWERGIHPVPLVILMRIAAALDVDLQELAANMPERKKFSYIASARRAKGITQKQFAKMLGISQGLVSNYETGACAIPEHLIQTIADVLGISTESIPTRNDKR